MKRKIICAVIMLGAISCQKPAPSEPIDNPPVTPAKEYEYLISASLSDVQTKIQIGDNSEGSYPFLWEKSEKISLFSEDGKLVSTLTLKEGESSASGKFSFKTNEEQKSKVRVVYPFGKCGSGNLLTHQDVDGNNLADIKNRCHFYSNALVLSDGEEVAFELSQALALVRVDCSCASNEGEAQITEFSISGKKAALSGDYSVNYDDGSVSYGESVVDTVSVAFYNACPELSTETTSFWVVVIPNESEVEYDLSISVLMGEEIKKITKTITQSFIGGKVNVVDFSQIDVSSSSSGDAGGFDSNSGSRV